MPTLLRLAGRSVQCALVTLFIACILGPVSGVEAAAQTPPTVSISPSSGTHFSSPYQNITVTACADNPLWSAATVVVNGSYYDGYDGVSAGGCSIYSGGWIASVTLQPGTNYVDAEVCDTYGNCAYASTIVYYDPPASYSISVTPDGGTATAQQSSASSVSFTVTNTGSAGTVNGSVSCSGGAFDCNVVGNPTFSFSIAAQESRTVVVNFSTTSAATGGVGLSVSFQEAPTVSDDGSYNITLVTPPPPPAPEVTADGGSLAVTAPGTDQVSFTINNHFGGQFDYSLVANCGPFSNCSASPSSLTLAPGTVGHVTVSFDVASNQNGAAGTVSLTATTCNPGGCTPASASNSVYAQFTPQHGVTVQTSHAAETLPAGTTSGSQSFTITNTSQYTDQAQIFMLTATCSGSASCTGQTPVSLNDGQSTTFTVDYTVGAVGTSGAVSLTALNSQTGSTSDTHAFSIAPLYALSVIPATGTQSTTVGTTGSYTATVQNTSRNTTTKILSAASLQSCGSPAVTNCNVGSFSDSLAQGGSSAPITVTYTAAQVGTGTIVVNASGTASQGTVSTTPGQMTVTVAPVAPSGSITVTPANDAVSVAANAGDQTVLFTLSTTRTGPENFNYTISCTLAATSCRNGSGTTSGTVGPLSNGQQATVQVTYHVTPANGAVGTITLSVQSTSDTSAHASGMRTINVTGIAPVVVATHGVNSGAAVARDACVAIAAGDDAAFECGDLRLVQPLPATTTMNKSRAPAMVYNSRHAMAVAYIPANVTVQSGVQASQLTMTVKLKDNDAQRTELPSVQRSYNWTSAMNDGMPHRVVVPVFATSLNSAPTGVYEYTIEASVTVPDSQIVVSDTGTVILVNRSATVGWWPDGVEQLFFGHAPKSSDILWVGGDGDARTYRQVGTTNVWTVSPTLDRPDTLTHDGSVWHRHLRNGAFVEFDGGGQHLVTQNAQGQRTKITYQNGTVSQIELPVPSGTGPTYTFSVPQVNGTTVSSTIDAPHAVGALRQVVVAYNFAAGTFTYSGPDTTRVVYAVDAAGRVVSRTNRRGKVTHFAYEPVGGTLIGSTIDMPSPDTNIVRSFCAAEGAGLPADGGTPCAPGPVEASKVRTLYDGPRLDVHDTTAFYVDSLGSPKRIVNALGDSTVITRGDARWPLLATALRQPNGFTTTATYTNRGLLATSTAVNPYRVVDSPTTRYVWNGTFDQVDTIATPTGEVTRFHYNALGDREWQEDGRGVASRTTFKYTNRQVTWIVEPGAADSTLLTYDGLGNLQSETTPLQHVTTHVRNAIGLDSVVRTPIDGTRQRVQSFAYDLMDRVHVQRDSGPDLPYDIAPHAGTAPRMVAVVTTLYDGEGNPLNVERRSEPDSTGFSTAATSWTYDAANRRKTEQDAHAQTQIWTYDAAGNPTRQFTRRQQTIRMGYDALNRLSYRANDPVTIQAEGPTGDPALPLVSIAKFPYYVNGTKWNPIVGFDSLPAPLVLPGDSATFQYDAMGQMLRASNRDAIVARGYFPSGALEADTLHVATWDPAQVGVDPYGQHVYVLGYTYDGSGRLTTRTDQFPSASGVQQTYAYNALSGLLQSTTHRGATVDFLYDGSNRLVRQRVNGGTAAQVSDSLAYDADGRQTHRWVDGQGGFPHIYSDALTYDAAGRVTDALVSSDVSGLEDHVRLAYNGLGSVAASQQTRGGTAPLDEYVRDALGMMVSHRRWLADTPTGAIVYRPESQADRLLGMHQQTPFWYGDGDAPVTRHLDSTWYGFDLSGNVTQQHTFNYRATFVLGNPADAWAPDSAGAAVWTWNAYDATDRLRVVQQSARHGIQWRTSFTEFRYDALGRRVMTRVRQDQNCTVSGPACPYVERTVWDGSQVLAELRAAVVDTAVGVDVETEITGTAFTGAVAYTHAGGLDAPAIVWKEGAGVVPHQSWRGVYEAGSRVSDGTLDEGRTWPGRQWDVFLAPDALVTPIAPTNWLGGLIEGQASPSGLQYKRNRFYDPQMGQFTQEDPIGLAGGVNLYGFAGGDPVNHTDPFGLCPDPKDPKCAEGSVTFTITVGKTAPAFFLGANAQAGVAIDDKLNATVFVQGGTSGGLGRSGGLQVGVQKGSINSLLASTEDGGGVTFSATAFPASGSVTIDDNSKIVGGSIGFGGPYSATINLSKGGRSLPPVNLIGASDFSFTCAKTGVACTSRR